MRLARISQSQWRMWVDRSRDLSLKAHHAKLDGDTTCYHEILSELLPLNRKIRNVKAVQRPDGSVF